MRRAKTDRLGLIAFAGNAFLTCPLTLDDGAFGQSVEALDTHSISQGGTAIAEAIEFTCLRAKSFRAEAPRRHQEMRMVVAVISVPIWRMQGKVDGDAIPLYERTCQFPHGLEPLFMRELVR